MNRRHFMHAASMAGLSVFTPWGALQGEDTFRPYKGPFWIMFNLVGGWDTTMFCDPKGREVSVRHNKPVNEWYGADEIQDLGRGFRVAPGGYYGSFLNRYKKHITIINGVDSQTNGHTQGERVTWSGMLAPGYPSLGALIAAERMRPYELPMPFLTFGGYENSGEAVTPTRIVNPSSLIKATAPDMAAFTESGQGKRFQDELAIKRAQELAAKRLAAWRTHAQLPRVSRGADALFTARLTEKSVERLLDNFDFSLADSLPSGGGAKVQRQALVALSAFEAGIAVSSNIVIGGWDSHGQNDATQSLNFGVLFSSLDLIMEWAAQKGVLDQLGIVLASDFGRTPFLNGGAGKDHWSVSSWMTIQGGKTDGPHVVGATDELMRGVPLGAKGTPDEANGTTLTPAHLHAQLRDMAGIDPGSELALQYPLSAKNIALFG